MRIDRYIMQSNHSIDQSINACWLIGEHARTFHQHRHDDSPSQQRLCTVTDDMSRYVCFSGSRRRKSHCRSHLEFINGASLLKKGEQGLILYALSKTNQITTMNSSSSIRQLRHRIKALVNRSEKGATHQPSTLPIGGKEVVVCCCFNAVWFLRSFVVNRRRVMHRA